MSDDIFVFMSSMTQLRNGTFELNDFESCVNPMSRLYSEAIIDYRCGWDLHFLVHISTQ